MAVGKDISPGRKNISLKEGLNILTLSFKLIKSTSFNNFSFDCYSDQFGQPWGSRSQIGSLLGYANPKKAIAKIHSRSNHRLDNFSVLADIPTSKGYSKPTILYSFKGLLEICRLSQQLKANSVMDFLWELADNLRRSGLLSPSNTPAIPQQVIPQKNMVIPQSGDYLSSVQETNSKIREHANILETTKQLQRTVENPAYGLSPEDKLAVTRKIMALLLGDDFPLHLSQPQSLFSTEDIANELNISPEIIINTARLHWLIPQLDKINTFGKWINGSWLFNQNGKDKLISLLSPQIQTQSTKG